MASSCDDDDNGFLFSPDDRPPNPNPNNHQHQYPPHHHHPHPPQPPSFLPRFPSKSPPVLPSSATAAASELAESGSDAPLHDVATSFAADENFGSPTYPAKSRSNNRRSHEELSDGDTTPPTAYAYKKSRSAGTAANSEYRKDREDWSDAAIACLLDVYAEKYAALNRGNLRGRDWEEVAAIVSERCGKQMKSVEQCKNKVDNLKKRFKLERHRMSNGGVAASQWLWYTKLEEIVGNMLPAKSAMIEEKGRSGGRGGRDGMGEVSAAPVRQSKR